MPEDTNETHLASHDDQRMIQVSASSVEFSGPLPHPDALARYEHILPGAAERILSMAERQAHHRQDLESRVVQSDVWNAKAGLFFGFLIGMTGIMIGGYLVLRDNVIAGSVFSGGFLIALVGTFVYGSKQRRAERREAEEE